MLIAVTGREFARAQLRSMVVLERRFRIHMLHREQLVFDTRFHPSARRATGATLFIVLAGYSSIDQGATREGPLAYVLDEHEFERVTKGASTLRVWGSPSITLELRIAPTELRVPLGLVHGPLALSTPTWTRCRELTRAWSPDAANEVVRAFLASLRDDRVITDELVDSVCVEEHERLVRLWAAMQPFFNDHAMSTSVLKIAKASGLSLRQLGRDTKEFARVFDLGVGFREASRLIRVRMAIMLLSAPEATATSVARDVGYRSLEAMERAFRDYGLPPPGTVQESLRVSSDDR